MPNDTQILKMVYEEAAQANSHQYDTHHSPNTAVRACTNNNLEREKIKIVTPYMVVVVYL